MKSSFKKILPVMLTVSALMLTAQEPVRTIHLRQNDAQIHFSSKIYELKYAEAVELYPFIEAAVKRYNQYSNVRRITGGLKREALLVTTGEKFFKYVDQIIEVLDRPNNVKKDLAIVGTGKAMVAYAPKYRAATQFSTIIDEIFGSTSGHAFVNTETNTIFWLDQMAAAKNTMFWLNKLDRPLPQVNIRLNYYELRDSDLKDWGLDYLAWKNGPGVNLFNVGYNAGHLAFDQVLQTALGTAMDFAGSATWGMGGFFTAPQFDMSFVRCLQQSGNANLTGHAALTLLNTPVATEDDYISLLNKQMENPNKSSSLYKVTMYPEYQNIAKNTLGRSYIGKSYKEDDYGNKESDPPAVEFKLLNPFVCFQIDDGDEDAYGFIPSSPEFYGHENSRKSNGGVIFDYALFFKNVVERGNTGAELSNSSLFTGSATLGFNHEKLLAVYEKENDVEQTIGLPVLCRIPILKYLFSTVTTIKERTHIIVTAEAELVHPDTQDTIKYISRSTNINRRIENPFKAGKEDNKK